MPRPSSRSTAVAVLAWVLFAGAPPARGQTQDAFNVINGLAAQKYLGTGKGVTVAVLDGGIDVTHPALRGSVYAAQDFTGGKNTDDDRGDAGHGTGVAGIIFGHDGKAYTGLAPGAKLINARVVTPDDHTSDFWAGNGLIWSAKKGAKVVNMSFGNKLGAGDLSGKMNLITDYVAERYGVNVTIAAGNENDTAVQQTPGGSYNGFTVGALMSQRYKRVADFSNYSFDKDARTKPDLVAPGQAIDIATADWEKDTNYWYASGTSFAAPMVAGVLTQLVGYGRGRDLPTDPLLMKAILLTSAGKVQGYEGTAWEPRAYNPRDEDYGYLATSPLDAEQGAGRVDALSAYRLYAKSKTKETPVNTWKTGKLKGDQTTSVKLGKLKAGQTVDASLTWWRHVTAKDTNDNDTIDAKDSFTQAADIADFTLTLLRDGTPVAASDGNADNLEHLFWTAGKTGNYTLEVYRFAEGGVASEAFALAARVLSETSPEVSRAVARRSAAALTADGALRGVTAVPEPSGAAAAVLLAAWAAGRRRRRSA